MPSNDRSIDRSLVDTLQSYSILPPGFFEQAPIEKILSNVECNATSGVNVAHHFLQLLVQQKRRGCVVFTSSIAAAIPTPFAAMYASTKAFVSQLAACLHIECQPLGIDVCAVHPSPVASNFYQKLDHKVDMIEAAAKSAVAPDTVTDDIFRSVGACAWRDLGGKPFSLPTVGWLCACHSTNLPS